MVAPTPCGAPAGGSTCRGWSARRCATSTARSAGAGTPSTRCCPTRRRCRPAAASRSSSPPTTAAWPASGSACTSTSRPDSLNQTWGAADRFTLVPRLRRAGRRRPRPTSCSPSGATTWPGSARPGGPTRRPSVVWPSLDVTGIRALLRHGLQPLTVIAVQDPAASRRAGRRPAPRGAHGVTIRAAGPADEEQVLDLELRLIRYDLQFGGPGLAGQHRPAGPRRDPRPAWPGRPPGPGWPSGTAARSACWSRSRPKRPAGSPG